MPLPRMWLAGAGVAVAAAALTAGVVATSRERAATSDPADSAPCAPAPLGVHELHPRRVAFLDPDTLAPLSSGVPLRSFLWGSDRAPGGEALAVGVGSRAELQLIDLQRRRTSTSVRIAQGGPVTDVARTTARLIVARVRAGPRSSATVAVVDAGRGRVRWRRRLRGDVIAASEVPGAGVALLLSPRAEIGRARLGIVRVDRSVASIPLERVAAGFTPPPTHFDAGDIRTAQLRKPGLAVTPDGERAFVAAAGAPLVAEVDVRSGAVDDHELEEPRSVAARLRDGLEPAAHAKLTAGSRRVAHWLGDGLLAISGTDEDGGPPGSQRPYGLRIADLEDDALRTVDPDAGAVELVGGVLVVWRAGGEPRLSGYDHDGDRLWTLVTADGYRQLRFAGCRAYLGSRRALAVIDVRNGRVLHRLPHRGDLPLFVGRPEPR